MNCVKDGCFKLVGMDGLDGFCADHKFDALLFRFNIVQQKLNQQAETIDRMEREMRSISEAVRRAD